MRYRIAPHTAGKRAMDKVKVILEIVLDEDGRWIVRLFRNIYGEYSDKKQARLHALEAAADARQLGHKVEVWDRSKGKRVL